MKTVVTQVDLLVVTALTLGQPFDESALTVEAWRLFPDVFCLKGYNHPDNNRVRLAVMMRARGVMSKGYFTKVGPLTYCLTNLGRKHGEWLAEELKNKNAQIAPRTMRVLSVEAG